MRRIVPALAWLAARCVVTGAIFALRPVAPVVSLGVLYLLAVLPVAIFWGHRYALPVAVASMLAFNFFFLAPVHTRRSARRCGTRTRSPGRTSVRSTCPAAGRIRESA